MFGIGFESEPKVDSFTVKTNDQVYQILLAPSNPAGEGDWEGSRKANAKGHQKEKPGASQDSTGSTKSCGLQNVFRRLGIKCH